MNASEVKSMEIEGFTVQVTEAILAKRYKTIGIIT